MKKKIVLSMLFTVTLLFSSFSISAFAEGNPDNGQMNMNEGNENYGEGPMNINEEDGPLRVNDDDDNGGVNVNATGAGDENNWEWLGLLGLAGLLGLRRRDKEAAR